MPKQFGSINDLRVASPCPVGWEQMAGDERVRFCHLCSLNVYNISAMTEQQVHTLVSQNEGRICARLFRRTDGTVLTQDCPVGLRTVRRHVARVAGAAFAAVLGFCSVGFSQSSTKKDGSCGHVTQLNVKRTTPGASGEVLTGVVKDPNGAVIAGAEVTLINERTKRKHLLTTTDEGEFKFFLVPAGKYTLTIAAPNFKTFKLKHFELTPYEPTQAEILLKLSGEVTVGILVDSPQFESSNGVTTFRGDIIQKLPLP